MARDASVSVMHSPQKTNRLRMAFAGVLLVTIAAFAADRLQLLLDLRVVLNDVLSPGRLLVAAMAGPAGEADAAVVIDPRLADLESQLTEAEQQRRQLLIENAGLRNRLQRLQTSKGHSEQHASLVGFDLISAGILSHHGMPTGLQQAMIDAGRAHGLTRSELVLDARGVLLDQGARNGVQGGHRVLAGSVVLGRVDRCGRWVSQLLPVTDESYSARVRLVRRSDRGTHAGVEGMLEGTGDACCIAGIPDTASVAVGDEVFAADINGVVGPQLYYGTVVAAEFQSSGWAVRVQPAGVLSDIEQVAVVVPRLETGRVPEHRSADSGEQTSR